MAKKNTTRGDGEFGRTTTQEIDLSGWPAGPGGCVLYVSAGGAGDMGRTCRLEAGTAVIGRDGGCDLALRDARVSRRHVRLTIAARGILVEDLDSRNGVTHLGRKIERATLAVGARIGVGGCTVDLLPIEGPGVVPLSKKERYGGLLGASLAMRRVYSVLEVVARGDAPVLIEGETGTGKDLLARSLHEGGPRRAGPFVVIDCGNVAPHLIESELFGHRRGSFTGAVADRIGAFEGADGGTVFLDEVGELPLELQPKLLRVLESHRIKRLGDVHPVPVNVRVVAATRRDLQAEVVCGRFRDDLFYRLAVVRLRLPPLRERIEDIPALAAHLAAEIRGGGDLALPPGAVELFMRHDWPGNVRELRNAVHRALMLGVVDVGLPPGKGAAHRAADLDYRTERAEAVGEFERDYLDRLQARFGANLSAAARFSGIDRKHLRALLKRHGLYRGGK